MVKHLPMYIQATGLPNLSTGPIFLREFHSFLSTVFLPTQIPPDALMAPLTGSIITTSTQANLIIIHYVSSNGHQQEIKGTSFTDSKTARRMWSLSNWARYLGFNVCSNPEKDLILNPQTLLAGRYFLGQDISDWRFVLAIIVMTV